MKTKYNLTAITIAVLSLLVIPSESYGDEKPIQTTQPIQTGADKTISVPSEAHYLFQQSLGDGKFSVVKADEVKTICELSSEVQEYRGDIDRLEQAYNHPGERVAIGNSPDWRWHSQFKCTSFFTFKEVRTSPQSIVYDKDKNRFELLGPIVIESDYSLSRQFVIGFCILFTLGLCLMAWIRFPEGERASNSVWYFGLFFSTVVSLCTSLFYGLIITNCGADVYKFFVLFLITAGCLDVVSSNGGRVNWKTKAVMLIMGLVNCAYVLLYGVY